MKKSTTFSSNLTSLYFFFDDRQITKKKHWGNSFYSQEFWCAYYIYRRQNTSIISWAKVTLLLLLASHYIYQYTVKHSHPLFVFFGRRLYTSCTYSSIEVVGGYNEALNVVSACEPLSKRPVENNCNLSDPRRVPLTIFIVGGDRPTD